MMSFEQSPRVPTAGFFSRATLWLRIHADVFMLAACTALFLVFEKIFRTWTFYLVPNVRLILFVGGALLAMLYVALTYVPFRNKGMQQALLTCLLVSLLIGVPGALVGHQVWVRTTQHPFFVHDGALIDEAAFDAVLRKENPYRITYEKTFPAGNWRFIHVGELFVINPAITHYIYLPATFLVDGAVGKIEQALFGFRDSRILFFVCHVAALALLFFMPVGSYVRRNALLFAFGLNPFTLHFLAEGRNDILVFFALGATFVLLAKKRFVWAGLCFGLACSLKQFAWLFIPALLTYFVFAHAKKGKGKHMRNFLIPALSVALIFNLPFLLWDLGSFIDDIILFPGGTSATLNYPISGFGASRLLVLAGFPPLGSFPFWIPVGAIAILIGVVGMWGIAKQPTLTRTFGVSVALLAGTMFFSRILHDNYIIFLANCAIFLIFLSFKVAHERN